MISSPHLPRTPPVVLSIAGLDPSSGAGLTADLQVFTAHGLFGTACPSALTVQSTRGVVRSEAVEAGLLHDMLLCLLDDLPPAGVKIGLLPNRAVIDTVATFLRELRRRSLSIPIVLDPVLRSSSGKDLLERDSVAHLGSSLAPLVTCMTPNRWEMELLGGSSCQTDSDVLHSAQHLLDRADLQSVIVTGGDGDPPQDLLLERNSSPVWLQGTRVSTTSTHGTGCAFSSALLSRLVLGETLPSAARMAKDYVEESLRLAPGLGSGRGPMQLARGQVWSAGPSS